jgi:cbb3-type cytochrome oxidase maturation protein
MDVTFYMFFSAFLMSMSAWCVFLWAVRTGQFRDIEETKYQIWPKDGGGVNESQLQPVRR